MINSNSISKELSLFIAILFYLLLVLLFALYLKTSNVKKFDAFNKTTTIELSIVVEETQEVVKKVEQVKSMKSEQIVKKSKSKTVKQQNSVKSLFANVKDYNDKVIDKEVKNVVQSEVASRYKAKFEKQRKSEKLSVSNLLNNVSSKASVAPSVESNNATDPYYSKIYEILAKRWNPLIIDDGLFAKVLVIITNGGKFDYKFLKYSGNEQFDSSLTSFLNEQVNILFPEHNKGSVTNIEVIFKSKG